MPKPKFFAAVLRSSSNVSPTGRATPMRSAVCGSRLRTTIQFGMPLRGWLFATRCGTPRFVRVALSSGVRV